MISKELDNNSNNESVYITYQQRFDVINCNTEALQRTRVIGRSKGGQMPRPKGPQLQGKKHFALYLRRLSLSYGILFLLQ